MKTQICSETNDVNSSRFGILYRLATGTIDLATASALLPGGVGHRCEGQWGFEYGGDPRSCERSLYPACEIRHPEVVVTMKVGAGANLEVVGVTSNPALIVAIDDLEQFLDVSEKIFDTSPVSRVAHYLWARGRTLSQVQCTEYFMDLWRICTMNTLGTPECGFVDFNNSNNEVAS